MELIQQYSTIFHIILVILAVLTICCLIRAVKGPSIADRLVAVNMMGTIVMSVIAVLALLTDEDYLVEYTGVYIEHRAHQEEKRKQREAEEEKTAEEKGKECHGV